MKQIIQKMLKNALEEAKKTEKWENDIISQSLEIEVDYPKNESFGDYTTNLAMILGKKINKNPLEMAQLIASQVKTSENQNVFEKIEVVAPGYINFYLSKQYLQNLVEKINVEKASFGGSEIGKGIKIDNEFISANPTGPLTVGNGRGGFYGDALSNVLKKVGFDVVNEYYVNDAGGQIEKLGHSVLKDEQAAYSGKYIDELNLKYGNIADVREVGKKAAAEILENIIKEIASKKMQINFDVWMSEQELNDKEYDKRSIEILNKKGLTYKSEEALWLRTTDFGDDKDRVLIKKDGKNAYMAGDCGYMLNKIERGYSRLIMGLGADHHGYVSRLKAIASALGFVGDFRIIISQMVRVIKDGKEVRMSKRAGNVVYIDELIEEIGHDVTRFFFLMYSPDTHMNFDLGLATEKSQKNPVFYVQYAHARICSILEKANQGPSLSDSRTVLEDLTHEKELSLIRELNKFPELIEEIAQSYQVHKLPHYAIRLADKFHAFYDACRVLDENDEKTTNARLSLVNAVRIVLSETLNLIGVSAPEKM